MKKEMAKIEYKFSELGQTEQGIALHDLICDKIDVKNFDNFMQEQPEIAKYVGYLHNHQCHPWQLASKVYDFDRDFWDDLAAQYTFTKMGHFAE